MKADKERLERKLCCCVISGGGCNKTGHTQTQTQTHRNAHANTDTHTQHAHTYLIVICAAEWEKDLQEKEQFEAADGHKMNFFTTRNDIRFHESE